MKIKFEMYTRTSGGGHNKDSRIKWIDCAKFVSMCGVVVDHMFRVVYNSLSLWLAASFSVGVFVLLSGISSRLTYKNSGKNQGMHEAKRLLRFFAQYAVATALVQIWRMKFWDFRVYISYLTGFNAEAHFYFYVFFFQLVFISPFLLKWCCYCGRRKNKYLWHIGTLFVLSIVSSICIRYTYILPVHGGGQYLFGGTYLLLYYLGMALEDVSTFDRTKRQKIFLLFFSGIIWIFWWRMLIKGCLPFDRYIEKYWGDGGNPPSVNYIVFSIISLFVLYAIFSLLEGLCENFARPIAFMGRYTIYTFMYHMLVYTVIMDNIPTLINYPPLVKWLSIYAPMIIFPVFAAIIVRKCLFELKKLDG